MTTATAETAERISPWTQGQLLGRPREATERPAAWRRERQTPSAG